jgi:F-type H+-transporting ATPase subunit b
MDELLYEPKFWVAVAFVLFVALTYKKISKILLGALDARSAKIKIELDHARRLREEAEQVLAEYKQKQAEYLKEAQSMFDRAQKDASDFGANAQAELKSALDTRMQNAIERIDQEELKAIQDVRSHVVDIALAAARALIIDHVSSMPQEELLKLALADIERKVH